MACRLNCFSFALRALENRLGFVPRGAAPPLPSCPPPLPRFPPPKLPRSVGGTETGGGGGRVRERNEVWLFLQQQQQQQQLTLVCQKIHDVLRSSLQTFPAVLVSWLVVARAFQRFRGGRRRDNTRARYASRSTRLLFFLPVSSVLRLRSSARPNAGGVSTCGSSEPCLPLATCRFDRNRRRICSREKSVRGGPDELKAEGQENRAGCCATIVVDAFVSSCPLRLVWRPKKPRRLLSKSFPPLPFPRGRCLRSAAVHRRRLVEVRGTSAAIYFVIFTAAATLR